MPDLRVWGILPGEVIECLKISRAGKCQPKSLAIYKTQNVLEDRRYNAGQYQIADKAYSDGQESLGIVQV